MLENIKYQISLKNVDKLISESNFELALNKLNELISVDFKPSITYLKRGKLCKKLFMYDSAYSDFTYIIEHCADKKNAYYERAFLNFETSNYYEAIKDSNTILSYDEGNFEVKRIKLLSLIYLKQNESACKLLSDLFLSKYEQLKFLFNETAESLAIDEYTKGLKLLNIIEIIDPQNPIKLLKEATVYGLIGDNIRQENLLTEIENVFPKYFVSHFRFMDMYQDKDILEICFLLELSVFDKQGIFKYPMKILEAYKNHCEGHLTDAKSSLEEAIELNPTKPEAYVLLAQVLQLMSSYSDKNCRKLAEENYKMAESIYLKLNQPQKAEEMRRQLRHLSSVLNI